MYHKIGFNAPEISVTRKYRFSKMYFLMGHTTRPQVGPFNTDTEP